MEDGFSWTYFVRKCECSRKIQQFKNIFMFDFYFPAHEKYVGKKIDWSILASYKDNPTFKKLKLLTDVTCISETQFRLMVLNWNNLEQHKCINMDLTDTLQNSVRCQKCFFPTQNTNYNLILSALSKIEDEIEDLYNVYEKTIVKEIREYQDNMQYLDTDSDKTLITSIISTKNLPTIINSQTVEVINKLFMEIDIVEVDTNRIITSLFPSQEMATLEELRKRFFALEDDLKKNKQESEIRIKLK